MNTEPITKICTALVVVAVIAAAAVLAYHGTLTGAQFLGVVASLVVGVPIVATGGTIVANSVSNNPSTRPTTHRLPE